jgi:hypothetical protein
MAMPAVIEPPGELMYSEMGFAGSSDSRKMSWAIRLVARSSSICQWLSSESFTVRKLTTPVRKTITELSNGHAQRAA